MRRLLPALLAALACVACTSPIFDPDVGAAVGTYRNIPAIGVTAPADVPDLDKNGEPDFDVNNDGLTFLPQLMFNTLDFTRGFVIRLRRYDRKNEIWYRWDVGSTVSWMKSPIEYQEDEGVPWVWPVTLKNNSSLGAIVFYGGDSETYVERLWADTASRQCSFSPAPHWYDLGDTITSQIGLGATPVVVGVSLNAQAMPGQDRLHALVRDGTLFSEAETLIADSGFSLFAPTMGTNYSLPFLGTLRHLVYFRDSVNLRSFAQWVDGDHWRTWAWWGNSPSANAQLTAITHRIDAVLSPDAGPIPGTYLFSAEKQRRIYLPQKVAA